MDKWYVDNLVCPVDNSPLEYREGALISSAGRSYPVVDGVPVMLLETDDETLSIIGASIDRSQHKADSVDLRAKDLYLESLGMSEQEKQGVVELSKLSKCKVDPVVSHLIAATNGYAYKHLIGKLDEYPIPDIRLPQASGERLLDVGCSWGRWSVAASRQGYSVVGIDPSLGAIMAARRVSQQLGLSVHHVVADARYLPFRDDYFDVVFSYSVLQHFSKENAKTTFIEVARVLSSCGISLIQMPNFLGVRCLQHQIRRRFREARGFEVRYWSVNELKREFSRFIGDSTISVDCYFGLGLQKSDQKYMSPLMKMVVSMSEFLRSASKNIPTLTFFADSLYVESRKR